MYVQDFVSEKEAVLDAAFALPKLHPRKSPDVKLAMTVVGDVVRKEAIANLAEQIEADLMDKIAMYEITNGEYADIPEEQQLALDEYESGMDDAVEAALERWEVHLSADWLGKHTIETKVWESNEDDRSIVKKLAESAAKEFFKQLTVDMTPAQVLSNAGIVEGDVTARIEANKQQKEAPAMSSDIDATMQKIKKHVGDDFDVMVVYDDFELLVEEDDELLANSAASRLGIDDADVLALQIAAVAMASPADELMNLLTATKLKSAAAVKKEEKAAKAEKKKKDKDDGIDERVFASLKHCGAGDTVMAEALGVSRSTYTKYVNGKAHLSPRQDQYLVVRNEIVERANKMLEALAILDNTELTQVS